MSNHPLARANAPPCARCSGMRWKSPYVTTFPDCIKDTAAKADVCTLVGWLGNLRESANKDLFESLSLHFFWTKTKQFYSWRHRCSPSSIGNSTTPWCHLVHSSNGDNYWSKIYLKLIWRSLKESGLGYLPRERGICWMELRKTTIKTSLKVDIFVRSMIPSWQIYWSIVPGNQHVADKAPILHLWVPGENRVCEPSLIVATTW